MPTSFSDEVVSVSRLRRELSSWLEKVRSGRPLTIVQGETADLAIVRRSDYFALESKVAELHRTVADLELEIEAMAVVSDPALMDSISAGLASLQAGDTLALDDVLAERRS